MTDHNPLIPILNSHHLDEIEIPGCKGFVSSSWHTISQQCGAREPPTVHQMLSRYPAWEPCPTELLAE